MNVLIVARTKMFGSSRCIGGLTKDGYSVRLLTASGENHDESAPFQIGQIWELCFGPRPQIIEPHVEDVFVTAQQYVRNQAKLREHLLQRVTPWRGGIDQLFGGLIRFTNMNNGYISAQAGIPGKSTGFWIPDQDLQLRKDKKHYDYITGHLLRGLSYVGEATKIDPIPAYTLVRVSLARWWKPDNANSGFEERCYLQLSGWY